MATFRALRAMSFAAAAPLFPVAMQDPQFTLALSRRSKTAASVS